MALDKLTNSRQDNTLGVAKIKNWKDKHNILTDIDADDGYVGEIE